MIRIKADENVVEIEASGSFSELLTEYASITSSLMHSFLRRCNAEHEYKRVAEIMSGAFCAGMKQAMDRRRKEVQNDSTEN